MADPAAAAATPTATPTATPAAPAAPAAAAAGCEPAVDPATQGEVASTTAAPGTAVKVGALTPREFARAHCRKPVLVLLLQPGSLVDKELLGEARAAAATVDGVVTLEYTPKDVKRYGDLPAKLGLLSTPGLATINRSGEIENFWTSYVDRVLIQRSLRNAAAAPRCGVTDEDAPAAPGSALEDAASLVAGI